MGVSRRAALGGACACGFLAACGGGPGGRPDAPGVEASPTSTPTPTPTPIPTAAPLDVPVADLPVRGSVVVAVDAIYPVAVTRVSRTAFAAHTAICTHLHCTTRPGRAGELDCGCHGSRFDATTGAVLAGPATRPLRAWPFTVRGDTLTLHAHEDVPTPGASAGTSTGE